MNLKKIKRRNLQETYQNSNEQNNKDNKSKYKYSTTIKNPNQYQAKLEDFIGKNSNETLER